MALVIPKLESLEEHRGCELRVESTNEAEKQREVSAQINPWVEVAIAWSRQPGPELIRKAIVTVNDADNDILATMEMILPVHIPPVPKICVYWDAATKLSVNIETSESTCSYRSEEIQEAQDHTWTILDSAFRSTRKLPIERSDFIALFKSVRANLQRGSNPILCSNQILELGTAVGQIRYKDESYQPYVFGEWLNRKPRADLVEHPSRNYEALLEDMAYLAVSKLDIHRTDFLHKVSPNMIQPPQGKRFSYALPQTRCTVDAVPFRITQFGMLMPSILHRLQVCMVGDTLSKTILADVQFKDPNLVVTAISTPSAVEATNYERFEFLGDSLLKICTSLQVLAEYPLGDEGYLTKKREKVITNEHLAKAALKVGLDRFIITEIFSGKWRPIYVQDLLDKVHMPSKRQMSTNVLADVVEALIGAAMVDGGMSKALACMQVFLPEINWQSLEARRNTVFERAPAGIVLPPNLEPLESLIGYSFAKKALIVEAMTHSSCDSGTASLERLEFFGDAVLDSLILSTMCSQEVELSQTEMHYLRTAFVNGKFLAFMCMEWKQETGNEVENERTHHFGTSKESQSLALWKFMRSQGLEKVELAETSNRHLLIRDEINAALAKGSHYPWALLSRLQPPRFISDIVESLLGAVYVDAGSLDACERVIETMGILRHLRRAIRDNVHILHPEEELKLLADVGHETVKYVIRLGKEVDENVERDAHTCEVFVGDQRIVSVTERSEKKEVLETKAAEAAVRILKERLGKPDTGKKPSVNSPVMSMI